MRYTIYSKTTGEIERNVDCPESLIAVQYDPAVSDHIEGEYRGDLFYVDAGAPVPFPMRPSPVHVFDFEAKSWIDPRSLDEVKAQRRSRITERRMAEDLRFPWAGKWYQADTDSWKQITGVHGWVTANGALPPWFPGFWKAEDNTYTPIPDVTTWWDFYGAALARGSQNFVHAETLKSQVAAATSIEEVEAVPDW